jgi:hypothetical protein
MNEWTPLKVMLPSLDKPILFTDGKTIFYGVRSIMEWGDSKGLHHREQFVATEYSHNVHAYIKGVIAWMPAPSLSEFNYE